MMFLDDALDNGQTQPRTTAASREEGLKNAL
jgi:hypothetical protein